MHVDTKNYKCCCCSLTTATYCLGAFQLIATACFAAVENWISFGFQLVISLMFITVFVNPNEARTRKILFYAVSIGQLVNIIVSIATFLYYLFTDEWID